MNIDDLTLDSKSLKNEHTKAEKEKKESKSKKDKDVGKSQSKVYDIDETINSIIEKSKLPKGKLIYDAKELHPFNLEFKEEYVDEDDQNVHVKSKLHQYLVNLKLYNLKVGSVSMNQKVQDLLTTDQLED